MKHMKLSFEQKHFVREEQEVDVFICNKKAQYKLSFLINILLICTALR